MIVRMGLLKKRADINTDQFRRHWREVHGPLAAKVPGLRAYHQNHVVDKTQLAIDHARGSWDLDGISELWFDDIDSMNSAIASDAYKAVAADSANCMAATSVIVAKQTDVVPHDRANATIKRMSILERKHGLTPDDFRHEWLDKHAAMVAKFPAIAGYSQNLVTQRGATPGIDSDDGDLAADGIVEMWFRNTEDLTAAFRSPAAEVSQRHALDFLQNITTFLVDVHVVV
ncbi:EthD family reductase [Bradyrhizobium prioriisuperbiae]|uniref:EthD domain-containing protein n=1 Tax=Bradyrhizobium prioriisuperbiae TaxID=2854389 RepID=UPI0028EC7BCC|nr:EthD family reductase [Bradyrhizobium prioritasuperba]